MMTKPLLIIAILILAAWIPKRDMQSKSSNIIHAQEHILLSEVDSNRSKDSDSIPPINIGKFKIFSFNFYVDKSGYQLNMIKIFTGGKLVQTIRANKIIERKKFELIDWNFDGYRDISVLYNCGSGGCAYWIWNYVPKSNRYVYNKRLSEVLGLDLDSINHKVLYNYRSAVK